MDDPRIEWLKNNVYQALEVLEPEAFEDLLNRDDGQAESVIGQFLNKTHHDSQSVIFFFKDVVEEEEEVEEECGMCISCIYVTFGGFVDSLADPEEGWRQMSGMWAVA